jgi:hypothetical protein
LAGIKRDPGATQKSSGFEVLRNASSVEVSVAILQQGGQREVAITCATQAANDIQQALRKSSDRTFLLWLTHAGSVYIAAQHSHALQETGAPFIR